MTISNCQHCKFINRNPYHPKDILCSLNPAYALMEKYLRSLDDQCKHHLPIDHCHEFEFNPATEKLAIALDISFDDWQKLTQELPSAAIKEAIKQELKTLNLNLNFALIREQWQQIANSTSVPTVRLALESYGIKAKRIPWICVDSSSIDAIAYLERESTQMEKCLVEM